MNPILLAGALVLASGCAAANPPADVAPASIPAPADERGAIYAAVLDARHPTESRTPLGHRYVQVETAPSTGWGRGSEAQLPRQAPEVTPELLAAFRAADARPADVRALAGRVDVGWITRDSVDAVIRAATTPHLPRMADFSATRFSPVGMSPDGRMALVYVSRWCGGSCGNESWALLERHANGRWLVRENVLAIVY